MPCRGIRIADVLGELPRHPCLILDRDEPLEGLAAQVQERPVLRNIYVVDGKGQLVGHISLGRLIRYLTAIWRRDPVHYHDLLEYVSFSRVSDLMDEDVIYAFEDDMVEPMLHRMVDRDIKEMPVVDREQRIVANISILDLWRVATSGCPKGRGAGS